MATNFPNSVDSLTNPTTSDTLASVSHSGQHADANDAIEAIQTALLDGAPLHIDDANDRVGIGTTNPTVKLHVDSGSTAQFAAPQIYVAPSGHASSDRAAIQLDDIQLLTDIAGNGAEDFSIYSNTAGAHRLSIDSSGNVGIGTYSPAGTLDVNGKIHLTSGTDRYIEHRSGNNDILYSSDTGDFYRQDIANSSHEFFTGNTQRLKIDSAGKVGIGTSSPDAQLTVKASSTGLDDGTVEFHSWSGSASSPTEVEDWPTPVLALRAYDNFYAQTMLSFGYPQDAIYQTGNHAWMFRLESGYGATQSSTSTNLRLLGQGTFLVGNFNASGTKTFRIQHPLPELNETHDLLHNAVESPQADNLYRGHATLVDGVATVNLDDAAGMTEGTFVLLNRDIQCFTSNENGWTAVRGSVTGNVLTIVAQDSSCVDTVSWLVVGERQDDEIKASKDTDDEGHLIVEPLTNRVSEADIAESEARMEAARQAAQQVEVPE